MQANLSLGKLDDPRFTDRLEAARYLESIRWPRGPVCPHCGTATTNEREHYWLAKQSRWKSPRDQVLHSFIHSGLFHDVTARHGA